MNRKSIEQIVYDKIKAAIVNKMIRPGTQLIEATLAENLLVSRTPIRNAFKRLEKEGYVTIIPNRGAFIIEPSKQEILDAFNVRIELELLAIDLSLSCINKAEIDILNALIKQERDALREKDIINYLKINKEFHMYFAKVSKNRFLIEFLERIIDQINVYLLLYDTYYHASYETISSIKEHQHIIKLIKEKKKEHLLEYIKKHLNESLQDINIDQIENQTLKNIL